MQSKEGDVFKPQEVTEMFRFIVDNMTTREELQWVKDNMATKEEFQLIKDNMATCDEVREIVSGEIAQIKENMATKEALKELRIDLRQTEQRLMDHTTRECAKVRGDLVMLVRREDEKTDAIVSVVERAKLVSKEEAEHIRGLSPFPRIAKVSAR